MIDLPRQLAAWKDELSIFPEEVRLSLVPLIPRLALAVGPMQARTEATRGAPDGFAAS